MEFFKKNLFSFCHCSKSYTQVKNKITTPLPMPVFFSIGKLKIS